MLLLLMMLDGRQCSMRKMRHFRPKISLNKHVHDMPEFRLQEVTPLLCTQRRQNKFKLNVSIRFIITRLGQIEKFCDISQIMTSLT